MKEPTKPEDMVTPLAWTVAFIGMAIVLRCLRLMDTAGLGVVLGMVVLVWLIAPTSKAKTK